MPLLYLLRFVIFFSAEDFLRAVYQTSFDMKICLDIKCGKTIWPYFVNQTHHNQVYLLQTLNNPDKRKMTLSSRLCGTLK